MTPFKVTKQDVDRDPILDHSEIGSWAFRMNGGIYGLVDTYEECQEMIDDLKARKSRKVVH